MSASVDLLPLLWHRCPHRLPLELSYGIYVLEATARPSEQHFSIFVRLSRRFTTSLPPNGRRYRSVQVGLFTSLPRDLYDERQSQHRLNYVSSARTPPRLMRSVSRMEYNAVAARLLSPCHRGTRRLLCSCRPQFFQILLDLFSGSLPPPCDVLELLAV